MRTRGRHKVRRFPENEPEIIASGSRPSSNGLLLWLVVRTLLLNLVFFFCRFWTFCRPYRGLCLTTRKDKIVGKQRSCWNTCSARNVPTRWVLRRRLVLSTTSRCPVDVRASRRWTFRIQSWVSQNFLIIFFNLFFSCDVYLLWNRKNKILSSKFYRFVFTNLCLRLLRRSNWIQTFALVGFTENWFGIKFDMKSWCYFSQISST